MMAVDPAVVSAFAALGGSAIGAAATLANAWFTGESQTAAEGRASAATRREALYAEFIAETSARLADALSRNVEEPAVMVRLHDLRLASTDPVIRAADASLMAVADTYAALNRTLAQLRSEYGTQFTDLLEAFADTARVELMAPRHG